MLQRVTWACVLASLLFAQPSTWAANAFQVDYVVTVPPGDPGHLQVRWRLAGIDEIASLRLVFRDDRATAVRGSGRLRWQGRTLQWTPDGPFAHLSYTVAVDRHRPAGGPHFDSHAANDWVAARAWHLFPEINVSFVAGVTTTVPTTRLIFELPSGWHSAATGERLARDVYRIEEPGHLFHRPRGWFLLGRIETTIRPVAGMQVTVARAPGSALSVSRLLHLYRDTVPLLTNILGPPPARLLIVSAPNPMWRGGLSGEQSFFVNGDIPLRSRDRTSTYLHELFHVWAPFNVGADGHWVSEGLAEYYTLQLQQRAGRLSDADREHAIGLFRRYGRWPTDLAHTRLPTALNNNAPFVMAALDDVIRRNTHGARGLDDAVRGLIEQGGVVTTAQWLAALQRVTGSNLGVFFRQYVQGGAPPVRAASP